MRYEGSLTEISGVKVGHYTDREARTGCTAVLTPAGAVGGVCVRGAAPGTRETDLLRPENLVERVHCVVLSGGSAYGLAAADGAMRWCEEHGIGLDTGDARVPIVPAAVLYDLGVGSAKVRPDAEAGRKACEDASAAPVAQGLVGAGAGATVGKARGMEHCMDSGLGSACLTLPSGVKVAALVAVNALGNVNDYRTGEFLAGMRGENGPEDIQTMLLGGAKSAALLGTNTTIGVVVTDAKLTKAQANRVASVAHDGYALSIRPVHTMNDGDTLFALSVGEKVEDMVTLCAAATEVTARAIANAVTAEGERL